MFLPYIWYQKVKHFVVVEPADLMTGPMIRALLPEVHEQFKHVHSSSYIQIEVARADYDPHGHLYRPDHGEHCHIFCSLL